MATKKKAKTALPCQPDPRAPLDAAAFLSAAQKTVATLRDDLLQRADGSPGVAAALRAEWQRAHDERRTGDTWEVWRRRVVVQIAAAWVLSLVFARTLEDRGLVDRNRIAGAGAKDSQEQFQAIAPYLSERDYLLTVFRELSNLPAARDLFDPAHNPVWTLGPSIDGARALLDLFRAPDAEAPAFRFGQSDTRFLGDLYQDLDEETQERFALLQTPRFVESFILDQTLEPAIREFGIDTATILDPTCGSGHFLLGAFERLLDHRLRARPGTDVREAALKALAAIHGVDINPYAVAIARFRLTLAFLEKGGFARIDGAPEIPLHVVVADSLLHGGESSGQATFAEREETAARDWLGTLYDFTDEAAAKVVLGKKYAAVVGNPPYITVKDPILREEYRKKYPRSAAGKYSLAAPFAEYFFRMARNDGFVGVITANSFMKREFGKKLIEQYLADASKIDLQLIVNTSGAYIPGHGTPTVLLFGQLRAARDAKVHAVLAKRGEPATPDDPEHGLVWRSIADHFEEVGFENDYISVAKLERTTLAKHPWSLGGGGAAELKELLEERAAKRLSHMSPTVGFASFSGEDDVFIVPAGSFRRLGIEAARVRTLVKGEDIRDWLMNPDEEALAPYDPASHEPVAPHDAREQQYLWRFRTLLAGTKSFGGKTKSQGDGQWWEWYRWISERYRGRLPIVYAYVSTHNQFVNGGRGQVFRGGASTTIIKLPEETSEDERLALLAYLNSSTACFWMKQVFYPKGGHSEARPEKGIADENRYEFAGTGLLALPIPNGLDHELASAAQELLRLAELRANSQAAAVVKAIGNRSAVEIHDALAVSEREERRIFMAMVARQEDVDWLVYKRFGLVDDAAARAMQVSGTLPLGRPFIVEDPPEGTSHADTATWAARRDAVRSSHDLGLIETATFKRKWWGARGVFASKVATYSETAADACRDVVAGRLEQAVTVIAEPESAVALRGHAESSIHGLVEYLVSVGQPAVVDSVLARESVPYLAAYRYTDSGLERRAAWERTWALQRREDAGEKIDATPVPPKYGQEDYRDPTFWRLRGKLDVPKERFISYPGCESDEDKSPVYGWAGWDHLQQAIALASLYMKRKQGEAWGKDRLVPMLAGLDELLPWIWQWHAEPSPDYGGMKPGQYISDFLSAQCQELGVTIDDLRAWRPEAKRGAKKRAKAAKKNEASEMSEENES